MLARFDSHFAGLPGRCVEGSDVTCRGDVPESCERFTGAETKSQSAHATNCDGSCQKITCSEDLTERLVGLEQLIWTAVILTCSTVQLFRVQWQSLTSGAMAKVADQSKA